MSELDDLEVELLHAADVWFAVPLRLKLERLIEIARGEVTKWRQASRIVCPEPVEGAAPPDIFKVMEDAKRSAEQSVTAD